MKESNKISGVKSIDFKIKAKGFGVINWNGALKKNESISIGSESYEAENGNHTIPKIRNKQMYISNNCIRHYMFKKETDGLEYNGDESYGGGGSYGDLDDARVKVEKLLSSSVGLIRGYMETIAGGSEYSAKRASPLTVSDFYETLGNVNMFEQFSSGYAINKETGEREKNSIYSKTTYGETEYYAYASLSIEQLRFISISNVLERSAIPIRKTPISGKKDESEAGNKSSDFIEHKELKDQLDSVISAIEGYLDRLCKDHGKESLKPKCRLGVYHRKNSLVPIDEAGIHLNNDAVHVLVLETQRLFESLFIKKASGFMRVTDIAVFNNDTDKALWFIDHDEAPEIQSEKFAEYHEFVKGYFE